MTTPVNVLPDAELAIIQFLRSRSEVTALVPSARITTVLPPQPTYPHVTLMRMGGDSIARGNIDDSAVQIDVWGGSRYACQQIARTIRACVLAIANDTVAEGTLVSGFEETAPQWLPDDVVVPPLPRFVARYRVLLHK